MRFKRTLKRSEISVCNCDPPLWEMRFPSIGLCAVNGKTKCYRTRTTTAGSTTKNRMQTCSSLRCVGACPRAAVAVDGRRRPVSRAVPE